MIFRSKKCLPDQLDLIYWLLMQRVQEEEGYTHAVGLGCLQREASNSIAFGSAPRREVDSQPISP